MILQLAIILVAIGTLSTLWVIAEVLLLEIFLSGGTKPNRSKSVQNGFDK